MTIGATKKIVKDFFTDNLENTELVFNHNEYRLEYQNQNYSIYFDLFIDNFGGKIWIYSQCIYKLNIVEDFYREYIPSLNYINSFGKKSTQIYNLLCNKNSLEIVNDFEIQKDEHFDSNVLIVMRQQLEIITCVFKKIKYELDTNLKEQFDVLKSGVFEFNSFDKVIMFHFFKPIKLQDFLIQLKYKFSHNISYSTSLDNYKILLKKICELNSLSYNDLMPKLSILNKFRILLKIY